MNNVEIYVIVGAKLGVLRSRRFRGPRGRLELLSQKRRVLNCQAERRGTHASLVAPLG